MQAQAIADLLDEIATYLELKDENPFKVRAFANAARTVRGMTGDLNTLLESGQLAATKGIGKGILDELRSVHKDGRSKSLEEFRKEFPDGVREMLSIPGLGAKKVRKIYRTLHIETLDALAKACKDGTIADTDGFGKKTAENILRGIAFHQEHADRMLFSEVEPQARALETYLRKSDTCESLSIAGSLRRHLETCKDVDLVASSKKTDGLMQHFLAYPEVESVTASGETKGAVVLRSGLRVDLRVVSPKEYPFALHHFTGSREHNTALRARAKERGLKLNEYGLFPEGKETSKSCKSEADIFAALDLKYIPPELRENMGELEEAETDDFSDLVTEDDIRGIFHAHTTYSDGSNTLTEMVQAAIDAGYEYLGITDHSQSAGYANGLKADRIKRQADEIAKLQARHQTFRIFHGIESDILKDGDLDYPDDVLASLDFVIGSVHSQFTLPEAEMTERLVRAIENPFLTMVGHLTGRLLLSRDGFSFNVDRILETAISHRKVIEINAQPSRLDLDWRVGRQARKRGLLTAVNPDAHSASDYQYISIGIGIARKAGFRRQEVLNTWGTAEVESFFRRSQKRT